MEGLLFVFVILVFVTNIFGSSKKAKMKKMADLSSKYYTPDKQGEKKTSAPKEASAMPHEHRKPGVYDSYNKHKRNNSDGAMPHSHNEVRYKHYDASKLPQGYILLNGEPVRVKDLENR